MSGKETIKAELPVPDCYDCYEEWIRQDCYEEWIRQAHEETLSTQQQQIQTEPESGDHESDSQSEKTEIVGYDKSTALRTAGEMSYVDASEEEYQAIVGSLMYLYRWTRPNLGFAVTFLSRYLHRPGVKHMMAAKHTLRYLQGTKWDPVEVENCSGGRLQLEQHVWGGMFPCTNVAIFVGQKS